MNIEVDTHTHTVLSGHAHSTIMENAAYSATAGIKGIVMSDHGPSVQASPPDFNIGTYEYLPDYIEGVRVYRGIEANIIDFEGKLDIRETYIKRLEFVIAGLHDVVIASGGEKKDTNAAIAALNNKYVDTLAHPDNPSYALNYEAVITETVRLGKLVEINNHSYVSREGSVKNAVKILKLCKKYEARIIVASDAHFAFSIGKFPAALKLMEECGFPESLIVNLTKSRFDAYIESRRKRLSES
jgi:putative hydrolase